MVRRVLVTDADAYVGPACIRRDVVADVCVPVTAAPVDGGWSLG